MKVVQWPNPNEVSVPKAKVCVYGLRYKEGMPKVRPRRFDIDITRVPTRLSGREGKWMWVIGDPRIRIHFR